MKVQKRLNTTDINTFGSKLFYFDIIQNRSIMLMNQKFSEKYFIIVTFT